MKILIELDVFSGQPNPTWVLENLEAKRIAAQLQHLPPYKEQEPPKGLGYRGFIVTLEETGEIKQTWKVYAGTVVAGTGSSTIFSDGNRVERQLLQMARQKNFGSLLDSLGVQ